MLPNFSLMINAPNAIRNDESWCTDFCGEVFSIFWFKFWLRYYLDHLYPTVICWQLPFKTQFKVGGWGGSKLSFYVRRARWCKASEAVLAVFLALVHLFLLRPPIECQLAIETLVKAISEVEGVFWQPTPEVDTSGLNDGSLHLIVRYWTLWQPQVRRTKTRLWWRLK